MELHFVGGKSGREVVSWIPARDLSEEETQAYAAQFEGGLDGLLKTGIYVVVGDEDDSSPDSSPTEE